MAKVPLRLIGDVHGDYRPYLMLTQDAEHTLQVGDLGFDYKPLRWLDATRHRAIAGNHDWYGPTDRHRVNVAEVPLFLGDYGCHRVPGFPPIFFVRGAWSIDHEWRREAEAAGAAASWWPEEELPEETLSEYAYAAYVAAEPAIVVTHEAPISLVPHLTDPAFARRFGHRDGTIPTRTNLALQRMLDAHRPKLWVCGHYHRRFDAVIGGTRFVCLDMIRGGGPADLAAASLDLRPGQDVQAAEITYHFDSRD